MVNKTDDDVLLIVTQASLFRTFLEMLRCFAFFLLASCEVHLNPEDDLWLIYKRGEKKWGENSLYRALCGSHHWVS